MGTPVLEELGAGAARQEGALAELARPEVPASW